jgi:hypothetical protein
MARPYPGWRTDSTTGRKVLLVSCRLERDSAYVAVVGRLVAYELTTLAVSPEKVFA